MQPLTGIFACLHTPNSFLSLPTLLSLKQTKYVTSHAKTFLTVSVRTVERTASERIRNGPKNHSKRLHWTAEDNLWTDEVEWLNGCGKFLNGWGRTDERLRKILERMNGCEKFLNGWGRSDERLLKSFERMRSNGWRKGLNGRNRMAEWLRKSSERQKSKGYKINVASRQKHKLNELQNTLITVRSNHGFYLRTDWIEDLERKN